MTSGSVYGGATPGYTMLKDGLVGLILLVPLFVSAGWRSEYRRLDRKTRHG
jgi:hypothetical protein